MKKLAVLFSFVFLFSAAGCGKGPTVKLPKEGAVVPQEVVISPEKGKPAKPQKIAKKKGKAPKSAEPVVRAPGSPARVAIIIDDAGHNLKALQPILNLPVKINVAILPRLKYSREIAEKLHENGNEVMLHQPMEPDNKMNPGPGAILTSMKDEEIVETLSKNLAGVPYLAGVNNHMGSKATADERVMEDVLKTTSQRKLFFVDSVTTQSKVREAATAVGVKVGTRDVFLDNDKDPEAIKRQVRRLKDLALKRGSAIGIGHFFPGTIQAIADVLPELQQDGVEVVPVSQLIE